MQAAWLQEKLRGTRRDARTAMARPGKAVRAAIDLTPVLSADEVQALVDYLMAKIVGK